MSDIYYWNKQFDVLNKIASKWSSIMQNMDSVSNIRNITSALDAFHSNIKILDSFNNISNTLEIWNKQLETYKLFEQADLSKWYGFESSVKKMMRKYDLSAISSNFDNLTGISNIHALENLSEALKVYDTSKYRNAITKALDNIVWIDTVKISDIVEGITEQYIEDNALNDTAAEEIRTIATIKDKSSMTERQIKIWQVYVYPFLLSLLFFLLSIKQPEPATINNITQVYNYYATEIGVEVKLLNECKFRIVCVDEVMPRIKPDCSSGVVEHLSLGKVVCVVNKYKKWVEITWENNNGEYCSGWIQNYKLKGFK